MVREVLPVLNKLEVLFRWFDSLNYVNCKILTHHYIVSPILLVLTFLHDDY